MAAGEFRCRVCYRKQGRLRFLSHLEVTHAMERGVRRAGLPYALTQGFSPHMKVAFGPALPTGTAGEREYLDIWLASLVKAEEVRERLGRALPADIGPVEVAFVDPKAPSLAAGCTIALYDVLVEGEEVDAGQLQVALDEIVAGGQLVVEHKGKTKVFDLALSLPKEPRAGSSERGASVSVVTRMGQQGSLRPDVLVSQALSRGGMSGAVTLVTRRDTLIETDEGPRRPI